VRADLLNPRRRAEDCPPYQLDRPQAGVYSINYKKSAREVFAGACSFYLENNSVATVWS
jgi:hypothetical protein